MFSVIHYLLSLGGAALGFYVISSFGPGGTMSVIMGAILGLPLGVFLGVLIVDLPRIGLKRYHIIGLLMSLGANGVALLLAEILMIAQIPMKVTLTIQLLVSVAACLASYRESEKAEKMGRDIL